MLKLSKKQISGKAHFYIGPIPQEAGKSLAGRLGYFIWVLCWEASLMHCEYRWASKSGTGCQNALCFVNWKQKILQLEWVEGVTLLLHLIQSASECFCIHPEKEKHSLNSACAEQMTCLQFRPATQHWTHSTWQVEITEVADRSEGNLPNGTQMAKINPSGFCPPLC